MLPRLLQVFGDSIRLGVAREEILSGQITQSWMSCNVTFVASTTVVTFERFRNDLRNVSDLAAGDACPSASRRS